MRRASLLIISATVFTGLVFMRSPAHTDPPTPAIGSVDYSRARRSRIQALEKKARDTRRAAWAAAREKGWPTRVENGDNVMELMALRKGIPRYYVTTNVNAAITTAADRVRETSPYNVDGAGVAVGVWDGGGVKTNHQELSGRVEIVDGSAPGGHATHVGGTIAAEGIDPDAKGMSPVAFIYSYNWEADLSEMMARGMSYPGEFATVQISNHSYVVAAGWLEDATPQQWHGTWGNRESDLFGQYEEDTRDLDQTCYDTPYLMPFKGAGNDRIHTAPPQGTSFQYFKNGEWRTKSYNPATDPYDDNWDNGGFDTIPPSSGAKNIMTVGAVFDAVQSGERSLSRATMLGHSSWGPTDDGRVKPDIVANGTAVYSTTADSPTSYRNNTGTSMSCANATGSAALLLQLYYRLFPDRYPRASTLKALIINAADDLGNTGPDYKFGWGLMNTERAARQLVNHRDHPDVHFIVEDLLSDTVTERQSEFSWDGTTAIRATLCWTDPPAQAVSGLDNPSPRLINDLDLRIVSSGGAEVYLPFVLDPLNPEVPATTGDNVLDNVEQVYVAETFAASDYIAIVSCKGPLTNGEQYFSLILTGQDLGQNIHVNGETGDDLNDGLASFDDGTHGPKKTIQAGIDASLDGCTVHIADGVYTGTGNRDIIFGGRGITLKSYYGPGRTVIDCQGTPAEPHRAFFLNTGEMADTVIQGITVINGYVTGSGGAVRCSNTAPKFINCVFMNNTAENDGGAIYFAGRDPELINCLIADNLAFDHGGGVFVSFGNFRMRNSTVARNSAGTLGGGVYAELINGALIENTILWDGSAPQGSDLALESNADLDVSYCCVSTALPQTYIDPTSAVNWGGGNIEADPVFERGTLGDFYLRPPIYGHTGSPCLDAGNGTAEALGLQNLTARKDAEPDTGTVDIGYHFPITPFIKSFVFDGSDVTITWNAKAGRHYIVNWTIGFANWHDVPVWGTNEWTDRNVAPMKKMYRIIER